MKLPRNQVIVKALLGILQHLSNPNKTHEFSAKWLQEHGIRTNSKTGRYIRSKLLIDINTGYIPGTRSKQYKINNDGFLELASQVGIDIEEIKMSFLQEKHNEVLQLGFTEGSFIEKSNRLWNPVQFVEKDQKTELMKRNGYMHDYDIQCCHPTLLYQYAKSLDSTLECQFIEQMLNDRKAFRQALAEQTSINEKTIKEVINSLFNSGKLGINYRFAIFRDILNNNKRDTLELMDNELLCNLRADIRKMWLAIKAHRNIDLRSGREKSSIARDLEKQVLDVSIKFLRKSNNKFIPEHDGWKCYYELDEYQLIRQVKEATGFAIKLEHINHNDITTVDDVPSLCSVTSTTSSITALANAHLCIDSLITTSSTDTDIEVDIDTNQIYYSDCVLGSLYYDCIKLNNIGERNE